MPNANTAVVTIGQAAREVGLATSALRYYERQGLLVPAARSGSGYRMYDANDLERLRFIRAAQAVGFTLDDIRTLLEVDQNGSAGCRAQVQPLLERRLAEVDEKMRGLRRVRSTLARALDQCRRSTRECAVLKEIRSGQDQRRPS